MSLWNVYLDLLKVNVDLCLMFGRGGLSYKDPTSREALMVMAREKNEKKL